MKRHLFGTVGAIVTVLVINGCAEDPTAALRGDVWAVQISRTYVELDVGGTLQLEAWSIDEQGNRLGVLPEITSSDPAVVSVTVDTDISGDPLPRTRFSISADGVGSATLTATAGGVSATSSVISFPLAFTGSVALDATGAVDILTISATSNVKFDEASSAALVNGAPSVLLSRTTEELQVAVISAAPLTDATVEVTNMRFVPPYGEFPLGTLEATTSVNIRTTLFDGVISVDASQQADFITLTSSASFEFAATAEVLIDGDPTFVVSRSATQLVVAGTNIDAVTGGTVTIENALFQGQFDVASVVAASTVDLEAFDNSVTTGSLATATDITAGPFPFVYYTLVDAAAPDQFVQFNSASDLGVVVTAEWLTGADVDIYWVNPAGQIYACGGGCSTANPEVSTHTVLGAVQDFLDIELYDGEDSIVRVTVETP